MTKIFSDYYSDIMNDREKIIEENQDLINYIFKYKKSYYKVVEVFYRSSQWTGFNCRVIKCTKTGKEFSDTNGFTLDFVRKYKDNNEGFYATTSDKCKTDNIDEGIKKRRITYLKNAIQQYQKELKKLENINANN